MDSKNSFRCRWHAKAGLKISWQLTSSKVRFKGLAAARHHLGYVLKWGARIRVFNWTLCLIKILYVFKKILWSLMIYSSRIYQASKFYFIIVKVNCYYVQNSVCIVIWILITNRILLNCWLLEVIPLWFSTFQTKKTEEFCGHLYFCPEFDSLCELNSSLLTR